MVKAKIIIQLLWKAGISWDESIPLHCYDPWLNYKNQLPFIINISFNRLIVAPDAINVQLHGFCGASEKEFGACIYVRSTNPQG